MMRLAKPEFDTSDYSLSRIGAQNEFFRALSRCAPEVAEKLRDKALRPLQDAIMNETWPNLRYVVPHLSAAIEDNPQGAFVRSLTPVRDCLQEWSRHYQLDREWCRIQAFYTLILWAYDQQALAELRWQHHTVRLRAELPEQMFEFSWAWYPDISTRQEIEDYMRRIFEEDLKKYLDRMEAPFKQSGHVRPKRIDNVDQFDWLVLYLLKGKTQEEILATCPMIGTTQAVSKAINKIATLIDLPLPKRRRPKRKNSNLAGPP